jgi:hypothetical protein
MPSVFKNWLEPPHPIDRSMSDEALIRAETQKWTRFQDCREKQDSVNCEYRCQFNRPSFTRDWASSPADTHQESNGVQAIRGLGKVQDTNGARSSRASGSNGLGYSYRLGWGLK